MNRFEDKVALVTGAGSCIGLATAICDVGTGLATALTIKDMFISFFI